MDDGHKVWTTVGSAGTLDQTDLAKVHLFQSIVQLGADLGSAQGGTAAARAIFPTTQAVVRYNVTPVAGLFFVDKNFKYQLRLRFRGHVTAKLMQVPIEGGEETALIQFDQTSNGFTVAAVSPHADSSPLDFVNNGYYVEVTLFTPAIMIGHPAAISVIQLIASPDFPG